MDDVNDRQVAPDFIPQAIYTGLSYDPHTLFIRAEDNFGGVDHSPAQVAFIFRNQI